MELIDKKKLLADLGGVHDVLNAAGDPFLASIMVRAIRCVENQPVIETEVSEPEAAAPDKDLAKAIRKLKEKYARGMQLEYVHNKLGWALYEVWKICE